METTRDSISQFLVVNPVMEQFNSDEWRDHKRLPKAVSISLDALTEASDTFFNAVERILQKAERQYESFSLEEVEVHAVITVTGKLALVSIAEAGGEGEAGLKFIFKRKK